MLLNCPRIKDIQVMLAILSALNKGKLEFNEKPQAPKVEALRWAENKKIEAKLKGKNTQKCGSDNGRCRSDAIVKELYAVLYGESIEMDKRYITASSAHYIIRLIIIISGSIQLYMCRIPATEALPIYVPIVFMVTICKLT